MKKILALLLVPLAAFGQPFNGPYPTLNYAAQLTTSANSQGVASNISSWANTNTSRVVKWTNNITTNGLIFVGTPTITNGLYMENQNNPQFYSTNLIIPLAGYSRWTSVLQTGNASTSGGDQIIFIASTNMASTSDGVGFGLNNGLAWSLYRDVGGRGYLGTLGAGTGGNGVNIAYSNCLFNISAISDQSNAIAWSATYPNGTNIVWGTFPWADTTQVAISNLGVFAGGTLSNGVGNWGLATGPHTINPRGGVESNSIFTVVSVAPFTAAGQTAGAQYIMMIPPGWDSGTNVGRIIFYQHGNRGTSGEFYTSASADGLTNDIPWFAFWSYVCTNGNNLIISQASDYNNIGIQDTWNTTNSLFGMSL